MKKLLFVSSNPQEVFIGELAQRLVARDFQVWRFYTLEARLVHYNSGQSYSLLKKDVATKASLIDILRATVAIKKHLPQVDCIHYHYIDGIVGLLDLILYPLSRKRTLATFWGSDYYKSSKKTRLTRRLLLAKAKYITFTNALTQQDFNLKHPKLASKTKTVRFGLIPLEAIPHVNPDQTRAMRERLGIPKDKRLVVVGTNASPNQNHGQIIKTLLTLDQTLLEQLHFLLPLGYPKNAKQYTDQIAALIPASHRSFFTLDFGFYKGHELAVYRSCTDILIQLQSTDQFSGAMQEVMASGKDVITASWLPYQLLKEKQVHFYQIDQIAKLARQLPVVLENPIKPTESSHNAKVINSLSHWEKVILDWVALYS
ncbi:MAG: glycosyltransferase [Dokdonia sp.]|jgi:hypothetical protein